MSLVSRCGLRIMYDMQGACVWYSRIYSRLVCVWLLQAWRASKRCTWIECCLQFGLLRAAIIAEARARDVDAKRSRGSHGGDASDGILCVKPFRQRVRAELPCLVLIS